MMSAARRMARAGAVVLLCIAAPASGAAEAGGDPAAALLGKYTQLRDQLSVNQFHKPLYLDSSESPSSVTGSVYALIDHSFPTAVDALNSPADWCEIMILHINTKYCRASAGGQENALSVRIGKKFDQPLEQAYRVEFAFRVAAETAKYLQVRLNADQGPLSTRDYRIVLEAIPLDGGRTFIHLSYSYAFDSMGRVAMQVYLKTIGRNKVGFTVAGTQPDGQPRHIGGMRGVVERNTMRYFLAIEAFLGALSTPPQARLEKRLRDWFAAAERYPLQLREMEQGEYLDMKRREYVRQQARVRGPSMFPQEAAHVQDAGSG